MPADELTAAIQRLVTPRDPIYDQAEETEPAGLSDWRDWRFFLLLRSFRDYSNVRVTDVPVEQWSATRLANVLRCMTVWSQEEGEVQRIQQEWAAAQVEGDRIVKAVGGEHAIRMGG